MISSEWLIVVPAERSSEGIEHRVRLVAVTPRNGSGLHGRDPALSAHPRRLRAPRTPSNERFRVAERLSRRCFQVIWSQSSEVVRFQTGPLCDSGEHLGTDFFVIVKRENEVRPAVAT